MLEGEDLGVHLPSRLHDALLVVQRDQPLETRHDHREHSAQLVVPRGFMSP